MTLRNEDLPQDIVGFLDAGGGSGREKAFRAARGAVRELIMWDEILECEQANRLKPEWARQALIEYAKKKYKKTKQAEQRRIAWQYRAFEEVTHFLKESYTTKRTKRTRRFSIRRACVCAAEVMYKTSEVTPEQIQNIRRAYENTLKRKKDGFYVSTQALRAV